MPNLFEFTAGNLAFERLKYRTDCSFQLCFVERGDFAADLLQERSLAVVTLRFVLRVPTFIVKATYQHRQLSAELHCFIGWQAVAQGVQNPSEDHV